MKIKRRPRRGATAGPQSGFALIYSVFAAFVVASMVTVMFQTATTARRVSDVKVDVTRARFMAQGALSSVEQDLRVTLANFADPEPSGELTVDGVDIQYTVTEVGARSTLIEPSGVQSIVQPYEIEATVYYGGAVGAARRIINAEWTPLFQFAVFYDRDLEILPGPSMTLSGRVHSNADMFLGCGGTLTFNSNHVRTLGSMQRRRKTGQLTGGTVKFRRYVEDPFDLSEPIEYESMLSQSQFGVPSSSGYDSMFTDGYDANDDGDFDDFGDHMPFEFGSQLLWNEPEGYHATGSTVRTGDHGVTKVSAPEVEMIRMWSGSYDETGAPEKGYYHGQAGLAIIVAENGLTYTATDADGNDVTGDIASAVSLEDIYDTRQAEGSVHKVPLLEIDVEALGALGFMPSNGLLYAAHEGLASNVDAKGVLLKNGRELPAPLTVVSEGTVYIQGDFNVDDKKGAAVIGDAVNLLSNAWDGSKEYGKLPKATETTYNVAMVTGSYESVPGRYNGGFENLPRFHENWGGINCNIAGSFVNSYDSVHATGNWGQRNSYSAPRRLWSYDTDFNAIENLPPFTPMAVSIGSVVTW